MEPQANKFLKNQPIEVALRSMDLGTMAYVAIQNSAQLNVLNSEIMAELLKVFTQLALDDDLRAVVLTGTGSRAFVGGADINELGAIRDKEDARAFITRFHQCCEAVSACPVPVLARIQGFALGAGMELAAACDIRIAAETAVFGMPEVKLGIPSVVEAALLPSLVGWGRTREMLLLGQNFSARKALEWGLVERVVPLAELDATVDECLARLLTSKPRAVRQQKQLIREWERLPSAMRLSEASTILPMLSIQTNQQKR